MRPICMKCKIVMRCKKNEIVVKDPEAGGFPSTYWIGDLWECPTCGAEIATGFGKPITHERAASIADRAHEFLYS